MRFISNIDFRGFIISQGFSSIKLELCDICKKNPPTWIEARGMGDLAEFRTSCEECHSGFLEKVEQVEIQSKIENFTIYDQLPTENNDITPTERPAWMEEFIGEGVEKGSILTLGSEITEIEAEIEDISLQEIKVESIITAQWSAGFVKEALFGSNPEMWLESQGAFNDDQIDLTIETLQAFHTNNVGSVKLSAILCLNGASNRNKKKKDKISLALEEFCNDIEDTVQNYAKEMLSKLK